MKEEIEGAILGLVQFIEELKAILADEDVIKSAWNANFWFPK
ncbi:hypothetical protein [Candidatus Parabeggiatoa sp. HSG14]|nr:hypothetical protein [Thiotrichales bacterium HSG14]